MPSAFLLLAMLASSAAEWHSKGMAHVESGELEDARICFAKAVELDSQSAALRINLGNVLARLGRKHEAIRQFQAVLSKEPDHVNALFNLGMLHLKTGSPANSLRLLERARALSPQDNGVVLGEASALLALNRPKDALQVLEAAGDQMKSNVHGRWIMGSANERLGRFTDAFEHFSAVVDLTPDDPRAYMALGLLGLKAKTPQMSAKVFEDAERLFPKAPEFKLGKVLVAQVTGRQSDAEQQCADLLDSHPDYAPARLLLATLYLDQRRYGEALRALDHHALESTLLVKYLRAATVFAQSEEGSGATVRSAMMALELALNRDARFADGHILLARYYRKTSPATTDKHLRLALEAEPASWQAQFMLAELHRKKGEATLAQDSVQQSELLRDQQRHSQKLLWKLFYGEPETQ
jgi:tetratricopeptide (TPR) repeat protein